jgi:hypothetical protein
VCWEVLERDAIKRSLGSWSHGPSFAIKTQDHYRNCYSNFHIKRSWCWLILILINSISIFILLWWGRTNCYSNVPKKASKLFICWHWSWSWTISDQEDDSAPRNQVKDHALITRSVVGGSVPYPPEHNETIVYSHTYYHTYYGCPSVFFHLGHSQSQQTTNYQSVVEWVRNQDKDHDLLVDMEHDQLHSELLNHGLWLDCVVRSRLHGPDDHFHNQGYDMEHDQLHSELLNHGLWLDCVVRSRLRGPDDHFHNQGYYNLVSTGARARARQSMTRTKNYKRNHSQSVNKRELIKNEPRQINSLRLMSFPPHHKKKTPLNKKTSRTSSLILPAVSHLTLSTPPWSSF